MRKIFLLSVLSVLFSLSMMGQNASWNYTVTTTSSNPISMTGGTSIGINSGSWDDGGAALNWPFSFQVYDDVYTTSDQITMNTNGVIRFDGAIYRSSRLQGIPIPTSNAAYKQFLSYGGNTDGAIVASSNIVSKVTGTAPNRVLTIAFTYYTYYSYGSSYHADIQVNFYEANDKIEVDYSNVGGSTTMANTLGINAGDGVFGTLWGNFPTTATRVIYTPGSAVSAPQSFAASVASNCQINLSWTKNTSNSDVIVAYNTTNNFGTPANGTSYSAGSSLGSATVLYVGSATSFQHTALASNTNYFYKIWSKTSSNIFSNTGLSDNETTNPVATPGALTATGVSASQIDLSWTLNTYSDDVIVTYNTVNSFATPQDGSTYTVGSKIGGQQTVLYQGSLTSFSHTGLTVNTTYYYQIWSVGCQGEYSNAGQSANGTTQSSSNPSNFSAASPSSCEINLSWTNNASGDNVMILRNTTNTFGTPSSGTSYTVGYTFPAGGTVVYNGSGTSTSLSSLLDNTSYYFKAFSVDGTNNYSSGVSSNATTSTIADGSNFTATGISTSQINLGWNLNAAGDDVIITYNTVNSFAAPSDGVSYTVGNQIASGQGTVLYKGSATSFSHTGLNINTTYYYKIWSYDCGTNYSNPGQTDNATTTNITNPSNLSVTANSSCELGISWTKSGGNDVMLLRNTTNTFGTPVNGTNYTTGYTFLGGGTVVYKGSATSTTNSSLPDNTTYYYKAFSVDGSNNYSSGTVQSGSTSTIADGSNFAASSVSTSQIDLSWNLNGAGDDVIITYNTVNSFANPTDGVSYTVGNQVAAGQGIVLYKGSATSFSHTGLSVNTTYYYKVWSYDCGLNYSSPGQSDNETTSNVSNPSNFTASANGSCEINLSWTKSGGNDVMILRNTTNTFASPTNFQSYVVGYTFAGGGQVVYNGSGTTSTETALLDNTTYYYKAFSKTSSNVYSSGTSANAQTTLISNPASLSAISGGMTQINLTWPSGGSNSVIVTYNTTGSFTTPTDGVTYTNFVGSDQVLYQGSNTSFNHTGLSFNTTYYYKIWYYDCGKNYSSPGATANATTSNITDPQAFDITNISSCKDSVFWTKNVSNNDVMVVYNTSNNFTTPTTGVAYNAGYTFPFGNGTVAYVGNANFFIHSPLFDNTKYYYKIYSKNSSNYYSGGILDSVTTMAISDPTWVSVSPNGTTQLDLSWTSNSSNDEVIIAYNTVNTFATPIDGISYNVGWQVQPGQGIILYKGSLSNFSHTSLNLNSTYYYKIWSYDCALNYSNPGQSTSGTTGAVADPQAFSATATSASQIILNWTKNASSNDVMIAYNTTNNFSTPSNGITYGNGSALPGGNGTVLYNGSATTTNHTGLNMNTTYYYKVWSKDASGNYSIGLTDNATTLGVANPGSLTLTVVSANQIDLGWTKNAASDSVIIVFNTANNFAAMSNGTSYVIGNQIAAGQGTVLYKGPATSFNHTGLLASTKYYYKAYSYDNSDNYSSPGLLDSATTMAPGVATFPYLETFDTQTPNQGNLFSCVTYYPLTSGWNNVQGVDDIDWVVRQGTTPNGGFGQTGPAGDHTTGNGYYLYTEASSCYNKDAWLVSPVFNFTSLSNPRLEFYYFMLGSGTGSINVQISTNGGSTWSTTNLFNKTGQQQSSQSAAWAHADISLAAYAGMTDIRLRIKGTTGFNYASDMAIDDVRIYQPQNMAVNSVTAEQDTINVVLGATNQQVMRINVYTVGAFSPLSVGQFAFNTTGTQDLSDITNARLFYTGSNPSFSTSQQVGGVVATPNGAFPITGSKVLAEGNNYFWLTYDIPSSATIGNKVDAQCLSVLVNGITQTPSPTSPSGDKTIVGQITVGTGTTGNWRGPVYPAYYHGAHESVYLASELGTGAKEINKVAWFKTQGSNVLDEIDDIKIYMKNSTGQSLGSGSYSLTGYSLVYQGAMPNHSVTGWMEMMLSNTFLWDGTSNLHVLVLQTKPATTWTNYPYYAYTTVSPNKARYFYNFNTAPTTSSNLTSTNQRPNIRLEYDLPTSMTYSSSEVIQPNTDNVAVGTGDVEIIGIKVETNNTANPLNLTKLILSTQGTTDASDISSAKVYYTGSSSTFATTSQFGSTVSSPSGSFTVNGTQTLQAGTNYFWLAYDVSTTATVNNTLDAKCDSITVGGISYEPSVVNPNGSRTLKEYLIIGTGTSTDDEHPLHRYYYHKWEAIYTSAEMGNAKDLSALAFYKASGTNTTNQILNVSIYVKHNSASTLSTGASSTTGYTQVFQGTFPNTAQTGWMEVPFDNVFSYNGSDNLSVLVVQNYGQYFFPQPFWAHTIKSANRARWASSFSSPPNTLTASNRVANIRFEYSDPSPMTYVSSTVTQPNTSNITAGLGDQEVIAVEVVTNNSANPLSATSFTFSTNGSSAPATDITAAKVYFTGTSSSFAATNQFGTTVANPNGTFTVTGSQALMNGTNYFWLAYDIPASATTGNWVDAECSALTVGSARTPTQTAPLGNRTIVGALSGEYTIGVGGDYTTFTAAVSDLNAYGVAGWVKFKVLPGTYTEQISLSPYTNASALNSVTFESSTGDSTDVTLQYGSSSTASNYVVQFSGSQYYRFRNMTIKGLGTTYSRAIEFSGTCSDIDIRNNIINSGNSTSTTASIIYAYNNSLDDITISNNVISTQGGYAMYIRGSTGGSHYNITIDSNDISSSRYSAYIMYQNGVKFRNNVVNASGSTFTYAVYCYINNNGSEFSGNKITSAGTSTAYGMYINNSDGTSTNRNMYYNNFVAVTNSGINSGYGIYIVNSDYSNLYHNNINFNGAANSTNRAAMRIQGGGNINLLNNMIVSYGGGVALNLSTTSALANSDYNNFYTTGSVLNYYGSTSAPSIQAWRTYSGEDANSINANPAYSSATDLHVTNGSLNNLGVPISGLTMDIDGDLRDASNPDIGADEFSVDIDGGVSAIVSPVDGCNPNQTVTVTFKNYGQNALSTATINWTLDGTTQTPVSWSGSLTTGQTDNVNLGNVNLTAGSHTIEAWSSAPNGMTDQITSNDTSSVTINISSAPSVVAGNDTIICSSSSFTTNATASGFTSLNWTSSGSGNFVGGTSLTATYTPSAADVTAGSVYLKLTASSTGCGDVSDSLLLVIQPLPALSFTGLASTYCPNDASSTLVGTPAGGVFSGPGVSGSTFDPTAAGSGTHTIKYVYTLGGCSDSITQTTTVSPTLVPTISGLDPGYCISSASSTLTGSPAGGTWSGAITTNVFNPAALGVGIKTVTYTVVDGTTSCSFDTTYITEVYSNPVASISGLDATYCSNDPIDTLSGSPLGGTFAGPGMNGNLFDPALAGVGTHTIQYAINNGVGCSDTAYQSVTVNAAPTASFSGLANQYCSTDAAVTLVGTPSGGTFSGNGISGAQFDPASAVTGVNWITYSFTGSNGCSDTAMQSTVINETPLANAGPNLTIWNGADTILYGSATGGSGSYSYLWSPATMLQTGNATLQQPNTVALNASQIYTVVVTDNNTGCSSSDQMEVTVNGGIFGVTTSSNVSTICEGDSVEIQALASGGTGTYSYLWSSTPSGYTSAFPSDWVYPTVTTTYTVIASDGISFSSGSVVITVNPAPVVTLSGLSTAYCSSDASVNMIGTPAGGVFSGIGVSGNTFDPKSAGSGSHTISYQYTDLNGCSAIATTQTLVNETPLANAGSDGTIAYGQDTIVYGSATGGGNYAWSWSPSAFLLNANLQNATTTTLTATQQYVLNVTDTLTGCYSNDTVIITVIGGPLSATASVTNSIICEGSSTQLNVLPSGGDGNYVYGWTSTPAGFTSSLQNPTVSPTVTTTYTVTVVSQTQNVVDNVVVTVNPKPAISANGLDAAYCVNGAIDTLQGIPQLGIFNGPGMNGNLFDPSLAGVGNHTITFTFTDPTSGCSNDTNMATQVYALPIANAGSNISLTSPGSTTLNGSASGGSGSYSYQWSPQSLVTSPTSAVTTTANLSVSTMFTLMVTDNTSGCSSTDDMNVSVGGGNLSVLATATPDTLCLGDVSTLNALATGGSANYTYAWSSNPVGFSSTSQNPTVSPSVTTTYTVTVDDGTGNANASIVVVVNPLPVVSISGLATSYCTNDVAVTLTGSPAGGLFSGSGIVGTSFDPSSLTQGSYNITYAYTDPNTGCFNSVSQQTDIYEAPTADAGVNVTIPLGNDTLLYGNATGGGNYAWAWQPALLLVNPSMQTAQTVAMTSTQLFTLSVTDTLTGCVDNDDVIVFVGNQSLSANIVVNKNPICEGDSVQMNVLASGGTGSYTYVWTSIPAGFTSTSQNPLVKPSVTTLYSVQVNDGVNTVTENVTITVNPTPSVAMVGLSSATCATSLPDTLLGFPAGGTFSGAGINSNLFDPMLAGVGTHYISYSYTDANGCSNVDIDTVDVNANPVAITNPGGTILQGSDTIVYGSALGGSGNYSYEWAPASQVLNAFAQNATTIALNMTTLFTLKVTDQNSGCYDIDTTTVIVKGGALTASPFANPDTICYGNSTQLNAFVSGGTGVYSYLWSSNPAGFTSTSPTPSVTPAVTTTFTVIADDGNGTDVKSVVVVVETQPIVQATSNAINCENGGFDTLVGSPAGGIFFGTGISGNLFDPAMAGVGTHQIIYSYTTAGGCSNSDTISTQVIASPVANAGNDIMIPCGGSGGLIGTNPLAGMVYSWSPTNGLTSPNMSNTIANPQVSTNYTLMVTDTVTGCSSTDQVLVDLIGGPTAVVTNDTIICKGESLTISASGGNSFLWSNGVGTSAFTVSPNVTTTYVVTVTDGGCSDVDSVTVYVNAPFVDLGPNIVLIDTSSFILDAGYGFVQYLWNTGDTTQSIKIEPYVNATLGLNKYGVAVMDAYGCITGDSISISYVLSVDELNEDLNMTLYPNPSNGQFTMEITGALYQNYTLQVLNITGQQLYSESLQTGAAKYVRDYDFRSWSKGVYFVRISSQGKTKTYKLVIN
jgi:hypothetical protein